MSDSDLKCFHCSGINFKECGFHKLANGERKTRYKCQDCKRSFSDEYLKFPAETADKECPKCGSNKTIKLGKPIKRIYGLVQRCHCNDCGREFKDNGRKPVLLYIKGKLVHRFWHHQCLSHVKNIFCPDCGEEKVILKNEFRDNREQKQIRNFLCLGCGRTFREGVNWNNQTLRNLGKPIPRRLWRFEDDLWDLRELYPKVDEYLLSSLFINFSEFYPDWYKQLVKKYIIWQIKINKKPSSLKSLMYRLRKFSHFIEKNNLTDLSEINREILAAFLIDEVAILSKHTLHMYIGTINSFFNWGNAQHHFSTPTNLITIFDRPKIFSEEPDPLEDSVIQTIRDNIYVLPKPIQLQFMLGFWLGARPSELAHINKECISLEPDGTIWWIEFKREKKDDKHTLPIETDIVRLIQQQQEYITKLHGEDYHYLFCHYQGFKESEYPKYAQLKPVKRPPIVGADKNPMVKAIRHLIKYCDIRDSNGNLANFNGAILRPSRATQLIQDGYSLDFVRIWLKHRSANTTKRHYTRYRPGELLDVATVMANLDNQFYAYDTNPESLRKNLEDLRQHPEQHELDGLKMLNGEPILGYCMFRDFCPRFGHCYGCGFFLAAADKLNLYKAQLDRLKVKEQIVFNSGSSEMLEGYQKIINDLEGYIAVLESTDERND